ncbi:MliC family protein [Pseudoroseicyclus tamaricis]|uniref:Lysozyme inhibitor n=1 Tax=Pseudoroseicyclus tamaricis TaxID=2705421 RepID=A0A6B2JQQ4_9RHOB|nr:MliC family protein [Pseudoroseicyclus tamaricis]NDV00478.1 lysozyme inhibitor [Pseudoroseicyclus tamaricis]
MTRWLAGAAALALLPPAASAEVITTRYLCERGVEIPVTYVNGVDPAVVVLVVEGRMMTLEQEVSGSGARYGWPSDGSHYVWWDQGEEATLSWYDGEVGEEVTLYAFCERQ